jgi:two-component system sensor histidine kinase/response regulator
LVVVVQVLFSVLLLESNFMSIDEAQHIAQEKRNRDIHIVRSVSDEKRLEAELLYKSHYQLFANASHEIRTPMNGIIGITDLLLRTNPSEQQKEYIDTIKWSSNILLGQINDILSAAKSDMAESRLEEVDFSLWDEVRLSTSLFDSLCHSKGVEICYKIEDTVPKTLYGASAGLRQVLLNLLGNALKFTSKGRIDVLVTMPQDPQQNPEERDMETQSEFQAEHSSPREDRGEFIQVEVRDTGSGIPEEARERIFEPFAQASDLVSVQYGTFWIILVPMASAIDFTAEQPNATNLWLFLPCTWVQNTCTICVISSFHSTHAW